ncbi:MAG: M15 family metallopeptidase, partial [Cyanobacteria bacterium P01_D01_bin.73]
RNEVLRRLQAAALTLQETYPGWAIAIYDAYRPIPVQQFMVDHTFDTLAQAQNLDSQRLRQHPTDPAAQFLWQQVHQFWALPSPDPKMPPPHSTGAAVDITLYDQNGRAVDMGAPIDECSPRSFPNHFADASEPAAIAVHRHRQLLAGLLKDQGFIQHPNEWWHFSWGDQLWAWQSQRETAHFGAIA